MGESILFSVFLVFTGAAAGTATALLAAWEQAEGSDVAALAVERGRLTRRQADAIRALASR